MLRGTEMVLFKIFIIINPNSHGVSLIGLTFVAGKCTRKRLRINMNLDYALLGTLNDKICCISSMTF